MSSATSFKSILSVPCAPTWGVNYQDWLHSLLEIFLNKEGWLVVAICQTFLWRLRTKGKAQNKRYVTARPKPKRVLPCKSSAMNHDLHGSKFNLLNSKFIEFQMVGHWWHLSKGLLLIVIFPKITHLDQDLVKIQIIMTIQHLYNVINRCWFIFIYTLNCSSATTY